MSVNVDVGPIDYLALEFPGARLTGEGLAILVDLVDRGIIRVLDMKALVRADDGTVTAVAISDLDGDGTLDLAVFEGVESDLLDEDDLKEAASLVEPGNAVALLVYENTWAGPFVSAMRRAGAEVVASVRIPADAVIARLEQLEAAEAIGGCRRRSARPRPSVDLNVNHVRTKEHTMGLIGGMARTAVVAGTATAVSNRVSRRQAGRWAAKEEQQQPQQQRVRARTAAVRRPAATSSGHRRRPRQAQAARRAPGLRRA